MNFYIYIYHLYKIADTYANKSQCQFSLAVAYNISALQAACPIT